MSSKLFYIETDGMVYLVERDGKMTFPTTLEELPFRIEARSELQIQDQAVVFCKPLLGHHPQDWFHRDAIPGLDSVDPLVRLAVNMTHPRVVTEAVIVRDGKILLVKPNRGFNKGHWTLPGGFISYGEPPHEAVKREVLEETGVACEVKKLLGVETFVGKNTFFTWHMFFFEVTVISNQFAPSADEIEEVRWFDLKEGLAIMHGIKKEKLQKLLLAQAA